MWDLAPCWSGTALHNNRTYARPRISICPYVYVSMLVASFFQHFIVFKFNILILWLLINFLCQIWCFDFFVTLCREQFSVPEKKANMIRCNRKLINFCEIDIICFYLKYILHLIICRHSTSLDHQPLYNFCDYPWRSMCLTISKAKTEYSVKVF